MTIVTEIYLVRTDGVTLVRTYSDAGLKIQDENGAVYDEAVNVQGHSHTYTELNEASERSDEYGLRAYTVTLPVGEDVTVCTVEKPYPIVDFYSDDVHLGNVRWAVDGNKLVAWTEGLDETVTVTMSVIG